MPREFDPAPNNFWRSARWVIYKNAETVNNHRAHRNLRYKQRQALKWDSEFISCKNHPNRRCKRALYVFNRHRFCSSCSNHRSSDGSRKPAYQRHMSAEAWRERRANKSLQRDPLAFIHKQMSLPLKRIQGATNGI
jgi:hypothetical protein